MGLRLSVCCLLITVSLFACSSRSPDLTPLVGTTTGLVELHWGESQATSRDKMHRLPGLQDLSDTTVVLEDEPLFISPDSVIPPRVGDLSYGLQRYAGGTFFGYPVEQWHLWFSDGSALCNVDILFPVSLPMEDVYADLGDRLLQLYGVPERGGLVWKKYRSRNWTERFGPGETPETGALLTWGRLPGQVTLSFHDLVYTDSLDALEYGDAITLEAWKMRRGRP